MIKLKNADISSVFDIVKLEVKESQKNFIATNTESIIEAYTTISAGGVAMPFGIYDDDTLIGFVMIGYGREPGEVCPSIADGNYCIWRFMIDKSYQGKGYSKKALAVILDYIKTYPCGNADLVYLSYEPENTVAASIYKQIGFEETGDVDEGEIIAARKL